MYSDLHRHLDGSLRPSTVAELAASKGIEVPNPLEFSAGMGLEAALACFRFTLALLDTPESVSRVAHEICEDAAADGVSTLEIRFGPQLHGPDLASYIDAAVEGAAGRAGILLCGLYGDDPALLDRLVDLARPGVVGLDLAGGPTPIQHFALADYAGPFTRAREAGLGRTVHAGEGRPPEEIRIAVEQLHAQRIGHGTTLLADPSVLDLVLDRGVVIEACPTSNVHTGAIGSLADHPLPQWLQRGVKCCVNTDNTLFSAVQASEEHARAAAIPGMTPEFLARTMAHGHAAAFPLT
jgi:adenosine deaminase